MRHNPAAGAIVIMLKSLKMHGMAQAVGELTEQGAPAFEAAIPILSQLLKAETAEREVRSTAYQLKVARFPAYRDLNGFDFASSDVNEALVRQLHRCDFLQDANNIVLVGGPGTGKTHIATAIGIQAIEHHHKRVRFFSTVELVNALEQEKMQGRAGQIAGRLAYADLVILDELGYLPFSASGAGIACVKRIRTPYPKRRRRFRHESCFYGRVEPFRQHGMIGQLAADDEGRRRVEDFGLSAGGLPQLPLGIGRPDRDEAPVLEIERGRRTRGEPNEFGQIAIRQFVRGIVIIRGNALLDRFDKHAMAVVFGFHEMSDWS
jgi:DNA replication protein DnaC